MLLGLLALLPNLVASVHLFIPLPEGAVSKALQLDSDGNIYVAGSLAQNGNTDAFVAKISPDGSSLLYFTVLIGSGDHSAAALAVASDGSAYVAHNTLLTRLDASGNIISTTDIVGVATALAIDSAGNLFVSGRGAPTSGPGGFLVKLDPTLGNVLLSINGYGGGLVTLDAQGNIYLAVRPWPVRSTPSRHCRPAHFNRPMPPNSASRRGTVGFALDCSYQYVAKFDPSGNLCGRLTSPAHTAQLPKGWLSMPAGASFLPALPTRRITR